MRYYVVAGAGGLAVGIHAAGFRIRNPNVGMHEPVLAPATEELDRTDAESPGPAEPSAT